MTSMSFLPLGLALFLLVLPGSVSFTTRPSLKYSDPVHSRAFSDRFLQKVSFAQEVEDSRESQQASSKFRRRRPIRPGRRLMKVEEPPAIVQDSTLFTNHEFSQQDDLHHPSLQRGLQELGFKSMTEIQTKSFAHIRQGNNVMLQAKTGSGKTLAYLLPLLDRLLSDPSKTPAVRLWILVPTRELVLQIEQQIQELLQYQSISTLTLFGGTKLRRDLHWFHTHACVPTIVVATPGRLLEHFVDNTRLFRGRTLKTMVDTTTDTSMVVLDEADRLLLDEGRRTVLQILSYLPRRSQTILVSATLPRSIQRFWKTTTKEFIDIRCDPTSNAAIHVPQTYLRLDHMDQYTSTLVTLMQHEIQHTPHAKLVVFFPATQLVRYFANILSSCGMEESMPMWHMSSRRTQSARTRIREQFQNAKRGILLTSDVSARGVDYPDVTLVIQYGAPNSKTGYIHRLGRTGRAGKGGKGLLVLLPFEKPFPNLKKDEELSKVVADSSKAEESLDPVRRTIRSGHVTLTPSANGAYMAFLAYYMANAKGLAPKQVFDYANQFALDTGLKSPPQLSIELASKLKLLPYVESTS